MTPQELKNGILQLAIQGRLVEQRPEEGTGEELYRQIRAEKQKLIKAGITRKEKPLPEITEDEKPFDIPDSWLWARIGNFCLETFSGKSPTYSKTPTSYKVIGQAANQQSGIDYSQAKYTVETFWNGMDERYFLRSNDVLLNTLGNGTLGRSGIIDNLSEPLLTDGHLFIFRLLTDISSKYFYYYLQFKRRKIEKSANGSTNQTFLSLSNTLKWLVPIPPLAEQKRIVAKIEELLPYIDRYEKAWSKLENFNKRFPVDMQKSILQMAIQGKLVEQRPDEGTGEELYRQIQAEKQKLIKAGTIKKEKNLPEIAEDEKPFDIPESWKWIRLGSVSSVVTGRLDANAQNPTGKYAFFTCGVEVFKTEEYAFDCDAVLLGGNNASGDYKMHRYCGKFNAYQRVYVISGLSRTALDYVYHVIKYWLPFLKRNSQGTTTRFVKLGQVENMLIPFPPLAEQKRIVAKLKEILPLCEKLR